MEKPYQGRAIVEDNFDYLKITIPAKRNYLFLVYIFFWLIFWGFIGSSAITEFFRSHGDFDRGFMIFWISGWAFGFVMAAKSIIWLFWGKEIIEIGMGTFSISRKNDLFTREKVYDLEECREFRIREVDSESDRKYWSVFYYRNKERGTIAFDYGMQNFCFGEDLYEPEAQYLLSIMKSKKVLTESQFK
ncbi:hypothetical protein ACFFGT_24360 [Mucilaginibacter angelicae]|uniref:YcxB-like protein domain-containing protein n=1 Tax=Mucilaginibacter angelicae TaxID=869718 RepID=A0ABV6LD49_9SPHI